VNDDNSRSWCMLCLCNTLMSGLAFRLNNSVGLLVDGAGSSVGGAASYFVCRVLILAIDY
jgi:hypothetical protein